MLNSKKTIWRCAAGATLLVSTLLGAPVMAADCVVKLGAVGPLSGAAAAWGLSAQEAALFVAAQVNQEGGLKLGDKSCSVEALPFDAQYTAAGGAAAANYLASEGVHITLGPVGSPETTGFREVAKRTGIINFSSSFMRDVITPDYPLSFHAVQAPITFGPILVKTVADRFQFKTAMIVGANDQGGTDATRVLKGIYNEVGVEAIDEYYQRGTTNFAAIATRIMTINPDTVDMATMPPADAAILVRQLLEAGYEGAFGIMGGGDISPLIEGADGIENLKTAYWLETSPLEHPGVLKLKEDYSKLMGKAPPVNPLFPVYTFAAEVALQGIAAAGGDQDVEKLAAALRELVPTSRYMGESGWAGKRLYNINQALTFPIGLGLVIDGAKQPVTTIAIPTES